MLIINADDFGGWPAATNAAMACHARGRITAVTAMVFMSDSARAAGLAGDAGMDVGLHVNFTQAFTDANLPAGLAQQQARLRRFLKFNRYAVVFYHPFLRAAFRFVLQAQLDEFTRLYGRQPSHIDGHQHKHLCANVLLDRLLPAGQLVRRSFSFWPGEKGWVNRKYRSWVDRRLAGTYRTTTYFFSLLQCLQENRLGRVAELAQVSTVELMTHPEIAEERAFLMGDEYQRWAEGLSAGTFAQIASGPVWKS